MSAIDAFMQPGMSHQSIYSKLVKEEYETINNDTSFKCPSNSVESDVPVLGKKKVLGILKDILEFETNVWQTLKLVKFLRQVIGVAAIVTGVQTVVNKMQKERNQKLTAKEIAMEYGKTILSTSIGPIGGIVHRSGREVVWHTFQYYALILLPLLIIKIIQLAGQCRLIVQTLKKPEYKQATFIPAAMLLRECIYEVPLISMAAGMNIANELGDYILVLDNLSEDEAAAERSKLLNVK